MAPGVYGDHVLYNPIGRAIACGSRIARQVIRWCPPESLVEPCVRYPSEALRSPLEFALELQRKDAVVCLLELGVTEPGGAQNNEFLTKCKRIVDARRAALLILLAGTRDRGCTLAVFPREMLEMIARAVYATKL